jgi:hypothetical protein
VHSAHEETGTYGTQWAERQTSLAGHVVPQTPQLAGSLCKSAQLTDVEGREHQSSFHFPRRSGNRPRLLFKRRLGPGAPRVEIHRGHPLIVEL